MKEKNLSAACSAALLAAVFAFNVFTTVASKGAPPQASSFSDLTLKISTPKEDFLQLEPIPVTLELSNETGHAVVGHTALDFSLNHVKLFVRRNGGRAREVKELSHSRERVIVSPRELAPGERHESRQMLTLNMDEIFPEPGAYEIQAVLYDAAWRDEVKSNVAAVKIIRPEGKDRSAFEFIRSRPSSPFFFSALEISGDSEAAKTLEEFEAGFGASTYGKYASFKLGEFYFHRKEYAKAKAHFDRLADKKDFTLADRVSEYRGRLKDGLPDPDKD